MAKTSKTLVQFFLKHISTLPKHEITSNNVKSHPITSTYVKSMNESVEHMHIPSPSWILSHIECTPLGYPRLAPVSRPSGPKRPTWRLDPAEVVISDSSRMTISGNHAELLGKWMELETFLLFCLWIFLEIKKIRSRVVSFKSKLRFRIWF